MVLSKPSLSEAEGSDKRDRQGSRVPEPLKAAQREFLCFPRDAHCPHIPFSPSTLRSQPFTSLRSSLFFQWRPWNSQSTWVPARICWNRFVALKAVETVPGSRSGSMHNRYLEGSKRRARGGPGWKRWQRLPHGKERPPCRRRATSQSSTSQRIVRTPPRARSSRRDLGEGAVYWSRDLGR